MMPTLTQIKANTHPTEPKREAPDHLRMRERTLARYHRRPGSAAQATTRLRAVVQVALVGCALALSIMAVSKAAAPGAVVGPHGTVASQGYSQWLRNSWTLALSRLPHGSACQSTQVTGTTVAMLLGGYSGKPERHTCSIRASAPVYVNGLSDECSTVEKPPFHGTTAADLRRCARHNLEGATNLVATVDGHFVRDYRALISASPVYAFHLPNHNLLGVSARSGRSAAYGEGLLVRGLAPGNHILHVTGKLPALGFSYDVTYTLHVAR